jgi:RNA polymerase sigma-54 factor
MKLEMQGQMRLEQQMKLAPHMIQAMEILQLPKMELEKRIEHELNSNPVLEIEQPSAENQDEDNRQKDSESEYDTDSMEDFSKLDSLDQGYRDFLDESEGAVRKPSSKSDDQKLEAIKNTAADSRSLYDYLNDQWRLVDAEEPVKKAGQQIIDYIDRKGYLTVRLEQFNSQAKEGLKLEHFQKALKLVQQLEPAGVGARDLKECLLIQMNQCDEDMSFEQCLVSEYMQQLLDNKLPQIAKKMGVSIDEVNRAVKRISKFDTSPGMQIGRDDNRPVTADVIVEKDEESGEFIVGLAEWGIPNLKINDYYQNMQRSKEAEAKTKEFLKKNIQSAQWIIEAIQQRKRTLLRVSEAIVKYQKDFFEKGHLYLKPLPMSKVADEVGIHLATVSRAVSGKYVQCDWGIIPLRKFFSGGTEDTNGNKYSWEAVRVKLQEIVDNEDKSKPLSDEKIRKELAEQGIDNLARRTVAKYRKILNIPSARYRKKY